MFRQCTPKGNCCSGKHADGKVCTVVIFSYKKGGFETAFFPLHRPHFPPKVETVPFAVGWAIALLLRYCLQIDVLGIFEHTEVVVSGLVKHGRS